MFNLIYSAASSVASGVVSSIKKIGNGIRNIYSTVDTYVESFPVVQNFIVKSAWENVVEAASFYAVEYLYYEYGRDISATSIDAVYNVFGLTENIVDYDICRTVIFAGCMFKSAEFFINKTSLNRRFPILAEGAFVKFVSMPIVYGTQKVGFQTLYNTRYAWSHKALTITSSIAASNLAIRVINGSEEFFVSRSSSYKNWYFYKILKCLLVDRITSPFMNITSLNTVEKFISSQILGSITFNFISIQKTISHLLHLKLEVQSSSKRILSTNVARNSNMASCLPDLKSRLTHGDNAINMALFSSRFNDIMGRNFQDLVGAAELNNLDIDRFICAILKVLTEINDSSGVRLAQKNLFMKTFSLEAPALYPYINALETEIVKELKGVDSKEIDVFSNSLLDEESSNLSALIVEKLNEVERSMVGFNISGVTSKLYFNILMRSFLKASAMIYLNPRFQSTQVNEDMKYEFLMRFCRVVMNNHCLIMTSGLDGIGSCLSLFAEDEIRHMPLA